MSISSPTRVTETDQLFDILRLIRSENIGPVTFYQLVNKYKTAHNALNQLEELSRSGLLKKRYYLAPACDIEKELNYAHKNNIRFLSYLDQDYPPLLRYGEAPPPILAIRGDISLAHRHTLSVVGSRNASANGLRFTQQLVHRLSDEEIIIVSGLARGIDSIAHTASLKKGTIAVLAGGVDQIYPAENKGLYYSILDQGGLIISEAPLKHVARAIDFPRRNRIVAACGMGLLVIEAALRSGTLITAKIAADIGRLVFAIPGSPSDARAAGTNRLLKAGALMVTDAEDILAALRPLYAASQAEGGSMFNPGSWADQQLSMLEPLGGDSSSAPLFDEGSTDLKSKIISYLNHVPVDVAWLSQVSGCGISELQLILTELELDDKLQRHIGNMVSLKSC